MAKKKRDQENRMDIDASNDESVELESVGGEPVVDGAKNNAFEEELKQAKNDYLYLAADFDNYKKQAIRERSELIRYGGERLVRDLLNVLDNFERALGTEVSAENFGTFRTGVEMTASELRSSLQKYGISEMESLGKPFDPLTQEAIGSEETSEFEPGYVCRVLKKAFKMHDRLLRPAQVIVAKPPTEG